MSRDCGGTVMTRRAQSSCCVSSRSSVAGVDYRYELRRGDEVVATGRLNYEQPLEVGDRIEIGGQHGIVSTIEPVLRERELRLVVQLLRDRS